MPGTLRLIPDEGETYIANPGQSVLVGRKKDCDLILTDSTMSRHHARVEVVDGGWHVTDLDSSNGTFVNGKRIAVHELQNGDELRFGSNRYLVEVEEMVVVGESPAPAPVMDRETAKAPSRRPASTADEPAAARAVERPARPAGRRGVSGRVREASQSGRKRRSTQPSSKTNMMPYYIAGGSFGLLVLVIIVVALAGGSSSPSPNAASSGGNSSDGNRLLKAQKMYRECYRLMGRKDYRKALDLVDEALKLHLELTDRYLVERRPDLKWLEDNTRQLSQWERQLGEWAFKEEMRELHH